MEAALTLADRILKMKPPKEDVKDRMPLWDSMQHLYMDTDHDCLYEHIARCCAKSKYTLNESEEILFNEVLPALRFNIFCNPLPEWTGFNTLTLLRLILTRHRYGKRRPWILRRTTNEH
ncbi:DUF7079 family protein [Microbulbifer sp. SSSA002]|uniref:DUF7079 family protein n=1 Tax=Microbulbifer sp. SSSA002 TaxID=3243376 RepID=UPI004039A660